MSYLRSAIGDVNIIDITHRVGIRYAVLWVERALERDRDNTLIP